MNPEPRSRRPLCTFPRRRPKPVVKWCAVQTRPKNELQSDPTHTGSVRLRLISETRKRDHRDGIPHDTRRIPTGSGIRQKNDPAPNPSAEAGRQLTRPDWAQNARGGKTAAVPRLLRHLDAGADASRLVRPAEVDSFRTAGADFRLAFSRPGQGPPTGIGPSLPGLRGPMHSCQQPGPFHDSRRSSFGRISQSAAGGRADPE